MPRVQSTSRKQKNGASHLSGVIDGAEALVAATADIGEEKIGDLRSTLKADLEAAREQLEKLESKLMERATGVDEFVHENPWQCIGAAAVAGVLVGAIAFRR